MQTRGDHYVALARDIDRPPGRPVADRRGPRRRRRWSSARGASRSPRSSGWSATPTRSTPSTSSACEPLDPLGMAPDYAMKGNLIHDALGDLRPGMDRPLRRRGAGASPRDRPDGARRDRRLPRHPCRLGDPLRGDGEVDRRLGGEALAPRSPSATPRSPASWSSPRPPARSRSAAAPTASTSATTAGSRCSTSRPARRPRRARCSVGFAPQLGLEAAMVRRRRLRRGLRRPEPRAPVLDRPQLGRARRADPRTPSRRD